MVLLVLIALLAAIRPTMGQEKQVLRGRVTDGSTGDPLPSATVLVEETGEGTSTSENGQYVLRLPPGTYTIVYDYLGYQKRERAVEVNGPTTVNVQLKPTSLGLEEVVVTDQDGENAIETLATGISRLDPSKLERLPTFMGSPDIIRGLLSEPGVSSVSEGAAGFNVRGGSVGQNLVLFNGAPVYYPAHMFGLFSPFNSATVSDVTLHKGSIPARFGGRISSVLRVDPKEGDYQSYHLRGGTSPIMSRLFVEGPIIEGRTSFTVGGRFSYVNWLLDESGSSELKNSNASFYDANLGLHHRFSSSDRVSVDGYMAYDDVTIKDTSVVYSTKNLSAEWKHIFDKKILLSVRAVVGDFSFGIRDEDAGNKFTIDSGVRTYKLGGNISWENKSRHSVDIGAMLKYHSVDPGLLRPDGPDSDISRTKIKEEYGLESALYVSDKITASDDLAVEAGMRLSIFNRFGPTRVPIFEPGAPRERRTVVDTATTGRGEIATTYFGIEPRLSLRYSFSEANSIKLSYDRVHQYVHLLSNSTAVAPTDVWHLSSRYREPQIGDQVSVGYFQHFDDGAITSSAQVYYKWIQNVPAFEPGVEPLLNTNLPADLLSGVGRAYGVEVSLKKPTGRISGRVNYTYSRTFRRATGPTVEQRINGGDWYPANHDRPHQLTARVTYTGSDPRVQWNFRFTYQTGRAITYPSSKFVVENIPVANVSGRNQQRVPDYHRLDLSLRIDLERREKRGWNGSWTFSLFNAYGHRNVSSVFFGRDSNGVPQAYSQSVLGTVFPSITYSFEY